MKIYSILCIFVWQEKSKNFNQLVKTALKSVFLSKICLETYWRKLGHLPRWDQDQDILVVPGSNIFLGKLDVGFLAVWKKSVFGLILWLSNIKENGEICSLTENVHVWGDKKPTFSVPTNMFDPSKNRFWSEFFDNVIVL